MISETVLLGLASVLTLAVWLPPLWPVRKASVWIVALIDIVMSGVLVSQYWGIWTVTAIVIVLYKLLNYARISNGRMQPRHLFRVSRLTALLLVPLQIIFVILAVQQPAWPFAVAVLLAFLQLVIIAVLVSSTARHLRTTKTLQATKSYTDAALPSISVLIPARNETDDLQACLQALIASNYPKLEIVVLDDCSQNKHTPEIIRSFAHDGVRFVAGTEPSDSWLAKNFAYQQLAESANGDYLVFCGADLQMSPNALRELITTLLEKDKTMLSVLPQNAKPASWLTYLIQPMRYAWELSLPRRFFNRPAVLSTCWVIKADVLAAAGGFKAVSRTITPESYFARFTARHDGYSFLRSNLLVSDKTAARQRNTAIRLRYPQLRRRPELVLGLTVIELLGVVLPLPMAVLFGDRLGVLAALPCVAAFILSYVLYLQVTGVMYGRSVIAGVLLAPLSVAYDIYILHVSMLRYEFGEVAWKDRNICLPVMRFDEPAASVPLPDRG